MRVIIVEDHEEARDELKYLLSLHPDIEVVGEFEDTAIAWPVLEAGNIDGAFLDINIEPEKETAGLDLARRVDRLSSPPWLVFTTGIKEHALTAHAVRPFGYLIKPFGDSELAQALGKIRKEHLK